MKWKNEHYADYQEMNKEMQGMNWKAGPGNKQNQDKWNLIVKKMAGDKWKGQMGRDSDLKHQIDSLWNSWRKWQTDNGMTPSAAGMFGDAKLEKDDTWTPDRAYRIDVTTNFDENWYKRKFKSGLLNKMIVGLKNQAMDYRDPTVKQIYGDKKYSVDDMTDSDKRKLDGIKWKMTNKIAHDYIKFLLGWSREKKYTEGTEPGQVDVASKLNQDEKFGEEMAEKALGNRGLLGRMKQKLFAGGQNSNVISVAFQPADWRDGWEKEEEDNQGNDGDQSDGWDDSDGEGGFDDGGELDSTPGGNGKTDQTLLQRIEKIEDKMTDNNLWGGVQHPPRTDNKYDGADGQKKVAQESIDDPFCIGDLLDGKRLRLIGEACQSDAAIDELICDCVIG